jgi:plastocyanin
MEDSPKKSGYGKRPLWQWILIYVVIAAVLYGAIYYFFLRGHYSTSTYTQQSYSNPTTQQSQQAAPSSSSQNVMVEYSSKGFTPQSITIKEGQTVTWVNKDTDPLQVASNPHPTHTDYPPLNAVGLIQPGQSKSFTFPAAGHYGYHNHLEPSNTGEVIVQ